MASLHAAAAIAAAAYCDIETANDGSPDNLFLVLSFAAAFRFHIAATVRAVLRQRDGDLFIHSRWNGTTRLPAVAAAGFASWTLRIGFGIAPRVRGGLALAGTQRGFQFPAQTFGFLFQPLDLFAQPLVFLLRSIQISFRNKLDALRLLTCGGLADWSHPTLR